MKARYICMGVGLLLFVLAPAIPAQSVWREAPRKIKIQEGFDLLYQQDGSAGITVFQILVKGGKKRQPADLAGVSYMTTRLALEPPDSGKVKVLMKLGSSFSWHVDGDYTFMTIKSLSRNLDETLEIFAAILANPLLSSLRINNLKQSMAFLQKGEEDDPVETMNLALLDLFFPLPGYGGSVYGTETSLEAIKRKDVESFYNKYFNQGNMVVAVVTDLAEDAIRNLVKTHFSRIPAGKGQPDLIAGSRTPDKKDIHVSREKEQVLIAFGAPVGALEVKRYVMALMLENILGKGAGSRLWRLRAEANLAYTVDARLNQFRDGGILSCYLKTDEGKRETALTALGNILGELYKEGLTEQELQTAKTFTGADFLRHNETREIRALNLAFFEACGLGVQFLENFFTIMKGVTLEKMNGYVKEVLHPDKLVRVMIGPG